MKLLMIVNEDRFFLSHRKDIAVRAQKEGWDVTIVCKNTGRRDEVEALGLKMLEPSHQPYRHQYQRRVKDLLVSL